MNDYIEANAEIQSETLALEEALKKGALAFFGEKYAESALSRLISTMELCGGCHTTRTGD